MKTINVSTPSKDVLFNLPTSLDELTPEYLKHVTRDIHVADHHILVGIVYPQVPVELAMLYKQKKGNMRASIIPIFVKAGNTDSEFIKSMSVSDKLIIPGSSLEMAYHVNAPENKISIDYFIGALDKDNQAYKNLMMGGGKKEVCYFVEFKIISNANVVGFYNKPTTSTFVNEYVVEVNKDLTAVGSDKTGTNIN